MSFGAGKVCLWLDSDGTYFPNDDQNVLRPERRNTDAFWNLKKTFEDLNRFIRNQGEKVELNVTTGRNKGEYSHYLNLIKNAGLDWIIPDRLVTKNGGDVFLKTPAKTSKTKLQPDWPSSINIDQAKRNDIKRLSNWDSDFIRSSILETLDDWDFPVVVGPTAGEDYGAKSYKHIWNLINDKFDNPWTAFVRQDGDLNFYIGLPPTGVLQELQTSIVDSIKEKLDSKNIKYEIKHHTSDWENSNGPAIVITPKINNKPLDKTYDVAIALDKAKKENDLVIVSGNGSNDVQMLDPDSYSGTDNPMMSIVVGTNPKLLSLAKKHPDKVIVVNQYGLLDGVKQAVKVYADKNPGFKALLDKTPIE